ncbi:alpha/beta-hydrolase [Mycena polygramma]|nr:alpha/beta-hydrolase [Mycena polygramma]
MNSLSLTYFLLALLFLSTVFASPPVTSPAISPELYDDLVLYTKYSSAAYRRKCLNPLGNTLIKSFDRNRTRGFIARDDGRQEIIVAFRGTFSLEEAIIDAKIYLLPVDLPDRMPQPQTRVHRGFWNAYEDIGEDLFVIVRAELEKFPTYRVVVTGDSLGGAIASIAAPLLKAALPDMMLKLYTFGQPRVGNGLFARYVEQKVGEENIFRAVHTSDGVPTIIPRLIRYAHFATEYWQFIDPIFRPPPETVRKCVGGEDKTCSASIPSGGINGPHARYFGRIMIDNRDLCF